MTKPDLTIVDQLVEKLGHEPHATIPILQAIQQRFGYLPQTALERVCEITEITPARIAGVSTFYTQFRHRPVGKHIIRICHGTACHVKGSGPVHEAIARHLGIPDHDDTDADKMFTLQKVACLGCCTLAPVVQIDRVTYGHMTADTVPQIIHDFLELQKQAAARPRKRPVFEADEWRAQVRIGLGSCCMARGSDKVYEALEQAVIEAGVPVEVKRVGCVGMCHQTPLVEVSLPDKPSSLYARVTPEDTKSIFLRHFRPKGIRRKITHAVTNVLENILSDEGRQPVTRYCIEIRDPPVADFLGRQKHIATEQRGQIDPLELDDYLSHDGFEGLKRCIGELSPADVIAEIKRSRLRGRGGAGYSTGIKWAQAREAPGDKKYVICNGDEGDPGAFMDRMLLESYPYRIIEGIAVAAYAVGADEGLFYIRAEYPLAVERIREALRRCEDRGLLGDNVLGSGFSLHLRIMEGAGAFVCGEETALLASMEGRRGMPRLRPPYPAASGLWGKPTLVNNAETYALVPWIIRNGPEAFAELGTPDSTGTKVFALAGKVARTGLIEVPMGITLREIVEEVGGGIAEGRRFKAVQVGGPSGGCVPARLSNTPVDYESLTDVGAIMGSGGLVVLDETDCMVDVARYFLQFTQDQSCGKCTFCRIGTRRMLDILDRICSGQGRKSDLDQLEQLALMVKRASLCGLGKTAPNPVLSTLRYFHDEYEAHLEKRCPAGKCKSLIRYSITTDCIGCTICAQHCPAGAIDMRPYQQHEIDPEKCVRCGTCTQVCPSEAIKVE